MSRRLAGLLIAAIALTATIALLYPGRGARGLSLGSAYAAYSLVVWALVIGPTNVLRQRPNPVHGAYRRDVGIAAGLFSVAHTVVGLQVHAGGVLSRYFLPSKEHASASNSVFLFANWVGLLSVIAFAVLVAISNNLSLRSMGLRTWKLIQRGAYPAAVLATVHGLAYQLLEKRSLLMLAAIIATAFFVVALQIAGMRARLRTSHAAARPS